jgi:5S rRNA maturation endonuclease (ribonuclease M5)
MGYIEEIKIEIDKLKDSNKLIIVEGKKDIKALKNLGLTNVIEISGALFETIEKVNENEVVLLMDMDTEGKKLYSKLKKQFLGRGVKIDNKLRHLLIRVKLSHIEGLDTYIKNENIKRNRN